MYSLLHDARAVRRVKRRFSDRSVSTASGEALLGFDLVESADTGRASGPAKYREKAILQA
jgi:hypothetical protein